MVEIINSSFIPRREYKKKGPKQNKGKMNIFFLMSLIIFLSTIVASVGVYLWKIDLKKTNEKNRIFLNKLDYGVETIKIFSKLGKRIKIAEKLLKNHYNLLPIFEFLEKNLLKVAVLEDLSLEEQGDFIKVKGKGKTQSLIDLQLQSIAFSENVNIRDLSFSDISKSSEGVSWSFGVNFKVNKKYLTDKNLVIK